MITEQYKILLAEDDPNLGSVIKDFLELKNHSVKWCKDGDETLFNFTNEHFDLLVLDVMMPKKDGFAVAQEVRNTNLEIPLIFLTAKGMEQDRIKGFKAGCDDYITKPFSKEELILRIKAIMKRAHGTNILKLTENKYRIGAYEFEYSKRLLALNGETRKLTYKEAEILKLLCAKINDVLPRDWAQKMVWGEDNYFIGRSMDVFITKLRKYLKEDPNILIENIHGSGFMLKVS